MTSEPRPPNLVALAGPNGSGKSTFFEIHLAKWNTPFLNRDVIAMRIAPWNPAGAALRAARVAEAQRWRFLEVGQSFVTEGIRPDPKLLMEATARGFFTRVVFICVESPELNVSRVIYRISRQGHSVPLEAVVARYDRALKSLPEAARVAGQLLLVDNSVRFRPPRLIARFDRGKVASLRASVPLWALRVFKEEFERFRSERRQTDQQGEP